MAGFNWRVNKLEVVVGNVTAVVDYFDTGGGKSRTCLTDEIEKPPLRSKAALPGVSEVSVSELAIVHGRDS